MELEDSYSKTYIKLFRSLVEKGWYNKSEFVHLWIHLLITAKRFKKEDYFNGSKIILKPGQFITGRKKLSEETGIHESKIERILTFFEKQDKQIEQQKSNTSRLITIINYEQYQQK